MGRSSKQEFWEGNLRIIGSTVAEALGTILLVPYPAPDAPHLRGFPEQPLRAAPEDVDGPAPLLARRRHGDV